MRKFALVVATVFGLALVGTAHAGGGCNYGGGLKTTDHSPIVPDTTTTEAPTKGPGKTKS